MAHIVDLEIIEVDGDPWFEFEWAGEDWHSALAAVKRIPAEARSYDEDTKRWSVAGAFEDELGETFPNFASSLDTIRSQMSMF